MLINKNRKNNLRKVTDNKIDVESDLNSKKIKGFKTTSPAKILPQLVLYQ